MLYQDAKLEELEPKSQKEGKRFKVIIQGGETYIQATDSFEEVFEFEARQKKLCIDSNYLFSRKFGGPSGRNEIDEE